MIDLPNFRCVSGMYAIYSEKKECIVRREANCELKIGTCKRLTDDQMHDIFTLAYAMVLTGKTMAEIMEMQKDSDPAVDGSLEDWTGGE